MTLGPLLAQYDPGATADLGAGYGQIAISQMVLRETMRAGGIKTGEAQSLRLYFRKAISLKYRQDMIEKITAASGQPKAVVARALEDLDPLSRFQEITHRLRMDMFDLADLATTYSVIGWEITNQRKADPKRIEGLRSRLRQSADETGSVIFDAKSLPQEKKQMWIESLAYDVMIRRNVAEHAVRSGKQADLERVRTNVREEARRVGLPIDKLEL
jgi:hypothetical protein